LNVSGSSVITVCNLWENSDMKVAVYIIAKNEASAAKEGRSPNEAALRQGQRGETSGKRC